MKYPYVIGGVNASDSGGTTTVERVALNDDGSMAGSFSAVGPLTVVRGNWNLVLVVGNYLYAIGGDVAPGTVERALIASDGSLGSFSAVSGLTVTGASPGLAVGNHFVGLSNADGSTYDVMSLP